MITTTTTIHAIIVHIIAIGTTMGVADPGDIMVADTAVAAITQPAIITIAGGIDTPKEN
jgi:hypothetical protein